MFPRPFEIALDVGIGGAGLRGACGSTEGNIDVEGITWHRMRLR